MDIDRPADGEELPAHHHYYLYEISDWWCDNCQTVTDYCKELNDYGQEVPLPPLFKESADTTLVCPHRDLSVCDFCAGRYIEIVEVVGAHYWVSHPDERDQLLGIIRD